MGSTSAEERARELLACCLRGERWPEPLVDSLLEERELFTVVVERLGDLFEPALCDAYADLFSYVIARVLPEQNAASLRRRYERVRRPRACSGDPRIVYVLSRITLGADVAVTSVVLDAAKRRFPHARIVFAGPRKNYAMFAADPRIEHRACEYPRAGSLAGRMAACPQLPDEDAIVIDPDSRLTQLGLLPVCDESRYWFFESRGYGGASRETLRALTERWAVRTLGVDRARAFVAPGVAAPAAGSVAVSLGVGENDDKRIGGGFERALLEYLNSLDVPLLVDTGAGGAERARVEAAAAGLANVCLWRGDFASFAAAIAAARLYVGYDSAGQHVAAAAGVPLVSVFGGYASRRMFDRWRPSGEGPIEVVDAGALDAAGVLAQVRDAVAALVH